jgi:hypothetical protein
VEIRVVLVMLYHRDCVWELYIFRIYIGAFDEVIIYILPRVYSYDLTFLIIQVSDSFYERFVERLC